MSKKGILFVFSAPSGTGKSTILRRVVESDPNLELSVSATTRSPREGETDGVDYIFLDKEEFIECLQNDMILEHDVYCDQYYGTLKSTVEKSLQKPIDLALEITTEGAEQIKCLYPKSVSIFIMPPSLKELENRIRKRGTEDENLIRKRLKQATLEMKQTSEFDYVVENRDLDEAVRTVERIIEKTRNQMEESIKYDE